MVEEFCIRLWFGSVRIASRTPRPTLLFENCIRYRLIWQTLCENNQKTHVKHRDSSRTRQPGPAKTCTISRIADAPACQTGVSWRSGISPFVLFNVCGKLRSVCVSFCRSYDDESRTDRRTPGFTQRTKIENARGGCFASKLGFLG